MSSFITIPQLPDSTKLDRNDYIILYNTESSPDVLTYKGRVGDILDLIKSIDSVNGKTGSTITITPDDLNDSVTINKFVTAGDKTKIALIRTDQGSGTFLSGDGTYRSAGTSFGNNNYTVNTIADRDLLSGLANGDRVLVMDASADTSVTRGCALYYWNSLTGHYVLIADSIELNFTISGLTTQFHVYTGTTAPATYQSRTSINTLTGTTLPATYQSRSSIVTLTGTTLPATYANKTIFNSYTGSTGGRISTIEGSYITGATNGLTVTGRKIKLGGMLTGATTISLGVNTLTFTQGASASGSPNALTYNFGSHSGLTISEFNDVIFNLNRNVYFSNTGTIATQRQVWLKGVTYNAPSSALAISNSATLWIDHPNQGTNTNLGGNSYQAKGSWAIVANGGIQVQNGGSTSGYFYQPSNATTVMGGGPANENITIGPDNVIHCNANTTVFQNNVQMTNTTGVLSGANVGSAAGRSLLFTNLNQNSPSSTTNAVVGIGGTARNFSSGKVNFLDFSYATININTGTTNTSVVGIYYNPTISNAPTTHYAALFKTGLVGIGTLTPTASLQINGSASIPTIQTVGIGSTTNYSLRNLQADSTTEIYSLQDSGLFAHTPTIQGSSIGGSWTATATNQSNLNFGGSFTTTNSNSDFLAGYRFTPSLVGNAASNPVFAGVHINANITGTASNNSAHLIVGAASSSAYLSVLKNGSVGIGAMSSNVSTALQVTALSSNAGQQAVQITAGGTTNSIPFQIVNSSSANLFTVNASGAITINQPNMSSGGAINTFNITQGNNNQTVAQQGFVYNAGNHSNQNGEVVDFNLQTNRTVTFANNTNISNQRTVKIMPPTYGSTSGSINLTNLYTTYIGGAPIWGSGVTGKTNTYGLFIDSSSVGGGTNSYGAFFNAQVGATNNYALGLSGNLTLTTAGSKIFIKEGTNAAMGVKTLTGGTATISTTSVTSNSRIQVTIQSLGTVSVPKAIGVTARTAGTSFTITSADNTDTSVIAWEIKEPA